MCKMTNHWQPTDEKIQKDLEELTLEEAVARLNKQQGEKVVKKGIQISEDNGV